ncbi:MAG TPA: hypothetical protein VIK35_12450 [Verrucomicrobiae bacterium]
MVFFPLIPTAGGQRLWCKKTTALQLPQGGCRAVQQLTIGTYTQCYSKPELYGYSRKEPENQGFIESFSAVRNFAQKGYKFCLCLFCFCIIFECADSTKANGFVGSAGFIKSDFFSVSDVRPYVRDIHFKLLDIPKITSGIKSQIPYQSAFKFSGKQFNVASEVFSLGIGITATAEPVANQHTDECDEKIFKHICRYGTETIIGLIVGYIIGISGFEPQKMFASRNKQKPLKTKEKTSE